MVKFDFKTYMKNYDLSSYDEKIRQIEYKLNNDSDMLDWFRLKINEEELKSIIDTSNYIKNNADVFIVIGIGGSFLGAKSVIDALSPYFSKDLEIIFAGTSLSSSYLKELINYIKDKNVIINVISKSGTTLEPNIAFDVLYEELKKKYDESELQKRIIITTDETEGHLRELVNEHNYKSFIVPKNMGGRYSVLSPVGLLPISAAGIDIYKLLEGAKSVDIKNSFHYASLRNSLYNDGKIVESFTVYEEKLLYFTEWLKQLFGETEGKEGKGILPISLINTRDLHSLGQFLQEGNKIIFETVINVINSDDINLSKYPKSLNELNNIAVNKVALAHYEGETYSNIINIDSLTPYYIGYLIYFFEVAAATSAYLFDLYPFDQPGVSRYKELINEEIN